MSHNEVLTQSDADQLVNRFGAFGDGQVSKLVMSWVPDRRCRVELLGRDQFHDWRPTRVHFDIYPAEKLFWLPAWQGSIQCGEVAILAEGGLYCLAVVLSRDYCRTIDEVSVESTSFFVIGRHMEYSLASL